MSNHENEIIAESIYESALELLGELATEKFGDTAAADEFFAEQESLGWVDRKMEELFSAYPEGPC